MQCEVCFKEIESGRRCKKHPEIHDLLYKEIRENASIGLECRMQELEAQQEPCYYQDTPQNEQVLPRIERPATPTQFQQIKGELNYLVNRLNEHLDKSKKKVKQYKYD